MSIFAKWERPRSTQDAIWQIEQTFKHNRWNESEQVRFLADVDLDAKWKKLEKSELEEILKNWKTFDNTKLKRILKAFESYRMILYK